MAINNVNTFKYTDAGKPESQAFKKGNWWIGTNDVGKGPTVPPLGYWNGFNSSGGTGYRMYVFKASQGPSIRYAKFDADLITYTNQLPGAGSFTSTTECFNFFDSNNDYALLNYDIPAVITSGATLYLEPNNTVCNPRNDFWWDLSQGLKFDAQNSQLGVGLLNGYYGFVFDGSGSWFYGSNPSLVDFGGDCTLIMWLYTNVGIRDNTSTLFQKDGTSYSASAQEIEVIWNIDTSINWYSRRFPGTDVGSIPQIGSSGWVMVGIKMSTGKTTSPRTGYYSLDGGSWVSSYTSNSNTAVVAAGPIEIGNGDNGTVGQGGLGMVMAYNRMLSDSEINRIYNNSKGLYGL